MKKLLPLLIAVFAVIIVFSCEKNPDNDKLESGNFVSTNFIEDFRSSNYTTYYLPDSIMINNTNSDDTIIYVNSTLAKPVLDSIKAAMTAYGYTPAAKNKADLGLQTTFTQNTYTFGIFGQPWYNSDYWGPEYWGGGWKNWYYPFVITYSYNTGSLLIDMIDLQTDDVTSESKPIIWNAYISSLVNPSNSFNPTTLSKGVVQAFEQSSYLDKQ